MENDGENVSHPASCWDDLPYFTAVEHSCGHTVEIHTLMQPDLMEFVPLVEVPCVWCRAKMQGADPGAVDSVEHTHFMYHRGDAVFRKTTLTVADFHALQAMEGDLMGDVDG